MDWILVLQIMLLGLLAYLLAMTGITHVIDKRREDAIKRREAGL